MKASLMLSLDSYKERLISLVISKRQSPSVKIRQSFIWRNFISSKKSLENKMRLENRSRRKLKRRIRLKEKRRKLSQSKNWVRLKLILVKRRKKMDQLKAKLCLIKEMVHKLRIIIGLRLSMKSLSKYHWSKELSKVTY